MKLAIYHADGCSTNLGVIGAGCNCGAKVQVGEDQKALNRALKLVRSINYALFDGTLRDLFRELEGHKQVVSHNIFPLREAYVLKDTELQDLRQKYLGKGVRG